MRQSVHHNERTRLGAKMVNTQNAYSVALGQLATRRARIEEINAYWQAVNYLGAAQLYLKTNTQLQQPLEPEHIKTRILGHWGTQPGINFIYAHLNRLIQDSDANLLLVTGPGHGAPALLANLYLEGTLGAFDERFTLSREGFDNLCHYFSWPTGLPSHLRPFTPGQIQEGGELGYSLAHAYGAAFDNPEATVVCIIGDGEAETGPLAAAWHSNKFINLARDGAVLPIVHLNGYKIGGLTVLGRMDDDSLRHLFIGYGYDVRIVTVKANEDYAQAHHAFWQTLDNAYSDLTRLRQAARDNPEHPPTCLPLIILRSPKGWTGPVTLHGKPIEGSFRSHGTPLSDPKNDPEAFAALKAWLEHYEPHKRFNADGSPQPSVRALLPSPNRRLGRSRYAYGGKRLVPLKLPATNAYAIEVTEPGVRYASATKTVGAYLRDVFKDNAEAANFRLVCPDEITSNKLDAVFETTERVFTGKREDADMHVSSTGRVMEILSEHTCQGWLEGYLITGRHGLFACYEAFITIIDSMANQHAKWLKSAQDTHWRKPIASLNYLLTSHSWRQDHNGYSHQGPGFINTLLTKKNDVVRIFLPPDANSLLAVVDACLHSYDHINLIIASKQTMPQWLSSVEAANQLAAGASVWRWAGRQPHSDNDAHQPDIILACAGDVPSQETVAAAQLLNHDLPELNVRVVNVMNLFALTAHHPDGLDASSFLERFSEDIDVTFAFHGYPSVIHQLVHMRPNPTRFHVHGYIEEGSTTTPFDMLVYNRMSRYHLALSALQHSEKRHDLTAKKAQLRQRYRDKLAQHQQYIVAHGEDMPEVSTWQYPHETTSS